MKMFNLDIHTDGACSGNPGLGGYCGIIVLGENKKTVQGYELQATNNSMELKAVVEAVKALTAPCNITVHTDSQYLCTCWEHDRDWFNRDNRPNKDLWIELIKVEENGHHKISFQKIKGHSGDLYNEKCDKLAKEQIRTARHALLDKMERRQHGWT